jgi:hypothetical protein
LISARMITFSRTPHLFVIEEWNKVPVITEIPVKDVKAVELSNNYTGSKYMWIFVLGIQIVLLFIDGFHFLLNPFAFGYGIWAGVSYIFTASVLFILLIYLLLAPQTRLHIVTDEKRYELLFFLPKSRPQLREQIEIMFEITDSKRTTEHISDEIPTDIDPTIKKAVIQNARVKQYSNIISGILFIFIASISLAFRVYAGDYFRMLLYFFGLYLIIKGFKHDFSSQKDPIHVHFISGEKSKVILQRNWLWMKYSLQVDSKIEECQLGIKPTKLTFFDVGLIFSIPGIMGLTLAGFFTFVPITSSVWIEGIIYTIISLMMLLLIVHLSINPQASLSFATPSICTDINLPGIIPIAVNERESSHLKLNVLQRYKIVFKNQKKTALIRFLAILLDFILGIVLFYFI